MKIKPQDFFILSLLMFSMLMFTACPKPQDYSDIPEIEFKQVKLFNSNDTLGNPEKTYRLMFGLIDGNGDIGLDVGDTIGLGVDSLYVNNVLTKMFEVKNGDTILSDSTGSYNFRIPNIVPLGQYELLIADVFIDWPFPYYSDTLLFDSILFEFYITIIVKTIRKEKGSF